MRKQAEFILLCRLALTGKAALAALAGKGLWLRAAGYECLSVPRGVCVLALFLRLRALQDRPEWRRKLLTPFDTDKRSKNSALTQLVISVSLSDSLEYWSSQLTKQLPGAVEFGPLQKVKSLVESKADPILSQN